MNLLPTSKGPLLAAMSPESTWGLLSLIFKIVSMFRLKKS